MQRPRGRETGVSGTQVASGAGGGGGGGCREVGKEACPTHRSRGGLWILFSVFSGATDLIVKISAAVGVIRGEGVGSRDVSFLH